MKISWKPALFILANLVFVVILALIILLILSAHGDDYELGWSNIIIIPACLFFVAIGIFLFILGKSYSISLLNKLLPFISLPAFFLPQVFTGGMKSETVPIISIIVALLIILEIYTTITILIRNRVKVAAEVTVKERQPATGRGIASFMRWGALGFVLGSLVAILPVLVLEFFRNFLSDDSSMYDYFQLFVSYAVMGGIGGALLGIKALNDTTKAWQLALAGALGFGLGAILPYPIASSTATGEIPAFVPGAVTGLVGGVALGLALKQRRTAEYLALTGAILFAVAHQILYNRFFFDALNLFPRLPIEAAIAGAALGATMGYSETNLWRSS